MIEYGLEWQALDSYFQFIEISTPATPQTNHLRLYAKDKSGASTLYWKSDNGTEYDLSGTLGGTGVSGRVAIWSGTNTLSSDADLTFATDTLTATNIVAPSQLTVGASSISSGAVLVSAGIANNWSIRAGSSTTAGQSFGYLAVAGTNTSDSTALFLDATGTNTYFRVRGDGKVGIGTNSPSDILDVRGTNNKVYMGDTGGTHTGNDGRLSLEANGNNCLLEINSHWSNAGALAGIFMQRSAGTHASPSVVSSGDNIGFWLAKAYDGSGYTDLAGVLFQVDGTPGVGDMPGRIIIGTTQDGSSSLTGRVLIGNDGGLAIQDGITAPATRSGWATFYVDTSDGDLKIKFGDGTVKTIVTD